MAETTYPTHTASKMLAGLPPGNFMKVVDVVEKLQNNGRYFKYPCLTLFCDSEHCGGDRTHDPNVEAFRVEHRSSKQCFVEYKCRHCLRVNKTFAIQAWYDVNGDGCILNKIGEAPSFGPPTPPRILRILGDDKELYLKGRRAESQGLGIAAFAYYRRVVENHKTGLIDEIIRVSQHLGAANEVIAQLNRAKSEISFEKSVEAIKGAIPPALLLKGGHNPLGLLHTALSTGLHNDNDAECLELAGDIRAVLIDFAERVQSAMKETAELSAAVNRLLEKGQKATLPKLKEKPSIESE